MLACRYQAHRDGMRIHYRIAIPVGILLLVVLGGGLAWWQLSKVTPVSVSSAVNRYRGDQGGRASTQLPGPKPGVYVFQTTGSESLSAGLTHHYPARTTLTVTDTGCGMQLRWDALDVRWMQWQLCSSPQGWRLASYTDFHQFLNVANRLDYTCGPDAIVLPRPLPTRPWQVTCTVPQQRMVITVAPLGRDTIRVAGVPHAAARLHVTLHGTGSSSADDTQDVWLSHDGLPLQAIVRSNGSQSVAGATIHYKERAAYHLASTIPLR